MKKTHVQAERNKTSEAKRGEMYIKFKWGNILEEKKEKKNTRFALRFCHGFL
jgi:hypothetical protein